MSSEMGTDVLALDDLLCSPDREAPIAEARAALPVGQLDQFDAAVHSNLFRDLDLNLSSPLRQILAKLEPGALGLFRSAGRSMDFADWPGWLRLGALHALALYVSGTGLTCEHAPTPDRPGPISACAWRKDAYTCRACSAMLYPAPGSEADVTCDECGRVCDPADGDGGIVVIRAALGPLEYAYGQCADCRTPPAGGGGR